MRIFIDIRVLNNGEFSGIVEYTRQLVKNLLKEGDGEEFIFFNNGLRRTNDMFGAAINYRIPNRLFDLSANFFNWPKIDKLIPADVYYSPNINILALNDYSKRFLTVHDLSFVHYPEFFGWRQRFWHWRQDYKNHLRRAGRIITVSDFTKNDLIETFVLPSERVVRIYPGVDPFYRPLNRPPAERPFIFYLGRIEPRKNLTGLIKAFNILKNDRNFKDLELIIAGAKGWLYEDIFKAAAASSYAKDIKFLGPVSRQMALVLYNQASVFVYPSFFEGFGFPPLEAQACGLPVVASDRASLPEILQDSAILVNPLNEEDLAGAIAKVVSDARLMANLIKKGLENVKRFSWSKASRLCLKLFRQKI